MVNLVLGTAQLGLRYGITNQIGIPTDKEIKKIFQVAHRRGVRLLDSALAYGNAHEKIANFASQEFDLVSKLPPDLACEEIKGVVESELKKIKRKNFYAMLFHSQEQIVANDLSCKLKQFQELKESNRIEKIGVSVYDSAYLDYLEGRDYIQFVQLPLNVLNQSCSIGLRRLKKVRPDIEIHVRSVFLQGSLIAESSGLPNHLSELKSAVIAFKDFCSEISIHPGVAALNYILQFPIDGIVLGITQAQELEQISTWFEEAKNLEIAFPTWDFHEQFDPRNW